MKRSRHRWLGLTLFCCILMLLSLELPSTSALKATSLIRKTTTTTTAPPEEEVIEDEQMETTGEGGEANATNSKLTGIPQIDYVHDPNLPRELNGYNLSEYPFLDTVPKPELIDFKCDGLHDGFYASVPLKCQVYHHCIYGFRHDFLCANYTAFDQKTFICQFVSEVDCKNSPNFWSRNDALYKATTAKPTPTTPPTTTTTTARPPRPLRRRRPYYDDYYDDEEYYTARDDYEYDDRPRRPRPRPGSRQGGKKRPVDDDYDEERYDRRRPGTARGRPNKRPYDRRTYDEDEDRRPYRSGSRRPRPRDEIDEKYDDERLTRDSDRETARDDRDERPRRPIDDDIRPKRPLDDDRDVRPKRPANDERSRRPIDEEIRPKRPIDDEIRPKRPIDDEIRPKRPIDDVPRDEVRPKKTVDDPEELVPIRPINYNRPRKEFRPWNEKPVEPVDEDDYEPKLKDRDEIKPRDEIRPRDDRLKDEPRPSARDEYRPRDDKPESRPHNFKSRDERRPFREDTSRGDQRYQSKGRRYDEPRDQRPTREDRPKDDRPRPFRERNYEDERSEKKELTTATAGLVKPVGSGIFAQPRMPPKIKRPVPLNAKDKFEYVPIQTTKAPKLYDDEYDDYDEEDTRKPSSSGKSSSVQHRVIETVEKEKFKPSRPHLGNKSNRKPIDYDDEYYDEPTSKNYKKEIRNRPKTDDYYYDEDDQDRGKQKDIETKVKNIRTNVKVVKRPFLPSRGGSPYLPRGLQPVAGRDMTDPINTTPRITTTPTTTSEPITNSPTTPAPTTKPTTRPTTRTTTTITTPKPTTTVTTQQTTTELKPEEEYEYYEEEDYDKKESTTAFVETTTKTETTTYLRTLPPETTTTRTTTPRPTTPKPTTPNPTTAEPTTTDEKVKNLETQVLRVYNENYEAIRDKLASTLPREEYINPYIATPKPPQDFRPKVQINPEISKPYTATGKPFIPENISIKQNLADSIENEFDVRINEALAPKYSPRIPTGFSVPDRDYTFARYRNIQPEPQFAASEISNFQVRKRQQPLVSIRTPNSYYIQPQRMFEDPNRYPRHLLYRPEFF